MSYIGKSPIIGNFVKLDAISVVNGQAAYTMQNGGSNFTDYETVNQFLVSLNGTIQAPTDSFTVSGSTLTFASNLSTGDVIDFIIVFGNSLSAGVPTDATVSTAKIVDDAVTSAKIADDGFPCPPVFISGSSYSWPKEVEEIILEAFENKLDMKALTRLTYIAGAVMADSVNKFIKDNNINVKEIEVLGVDGQTIYQEPPSHDKILKLTDEEKNNYVNRWLDGPYPAGYQIGDTSVIAGLTNITTVTNFRQADHVWGGSAAPFMLFLDFVLFRHKEKGTLTLNIGGIANITDIDKDFKITSRDIGPGNCMIDDWVRSNSNSIFDNKGNIASYG